MGGWTRSASLLSYNPRTLVLPLGTPTISDYLFYILTEISTLKPKLNEEKFWNIPKITRHISVEEMENALIINAMTL